ncbi:tRNA isopentenyltransferase [Russula earlei]|uniref:tRNA isopentenyltransferase n=1 Tax=Russula earlei TaxID=71964 RepID=A0ACC0UB76_9AGAM|nr:tRNA isopentenyltransferase [Russula earlei]
MSLPRVAQMALRPVIAICGTTGVGKSKLGVELALKLSENIDRHGWTGGVVVNADAMQAYKGFDTITNKIPPGERAGYVIGQWIHDATRAISDAHDSKKVPIIVGGTAYWIQHLIFPGRLAVEPEQVSCPDSSPSASTVSPSDGLLSALSQVTVDLRSLFDSLPESPPLAADDPGAALALHNLLQALDPDVAARWHWRDTRKVLRNLEIMKNSGRKVSEVLQEQSAASLRPRYDTLFLWLYAEPTELKRRLDIRADEMLENGLLDEVRTLTNLASPSDEVGSGSGTTASSINYTHGVFQSIGFREFNRYLADPSPSEIKFQAAVQNLKTANHQYAKRQITWIRNKLLSAVRASKSTTGVGMYLLDATELQKWSSDVSDVASNLMEAFLRCDPLPDPPSLSSAAQRMLSVPAKAAATDPTAALLAHRKLLCSVCTVNDALPVMIEEGSQWAAHVKSTAHKRLAAKQAKRKERVHDVLPAATVSSERGRGDNRWRPY